MAKYSINLLQPELLVTQPVLSLRRLVSVWSAGAVIIVSLVLWGQFHLYQLNQDINELSNIETRQTNQLAQLQSQINQHIADPNLLLKLSQIKMMTANKQSLQKSLTDRTSPYAIGFSTAMTELSQLHHKDIYLQRINISSDELSFSGIARTANAVPSWLAGFKQSDFLSGKSFIGFSLLENPEQQLEFIVSTLPIEIPESVDSTTPLNTTLQAARSAPAMSAEEAEKARQQAIILSELASALEPK